MEELTEKYKEIQTEFYALVEVLVDLTKEIKQLSNVMGRTR